MKPTAAAAPAPQAPLNFWEVSCSGKAVEEQPSRSLSVSVEKTGFHFALAAPTRFWQFLSLAIAGSHPLALKLLQMLQQFFAHLH